MGQRKRDIREIRAIAAEFGIDPREFGDYIEECKSGGDRGTKNDRGDFTLSELRAKAAEYKETL